MKTAALIKLLIPQLAQVKGAGVFSTVVISKAREMQEKIVAAGKEDSIDTSALALEFDALIAAETTEYQQLALKDLVARLDLALDELVRGGFPEYRHVDDTDTLVALHDLRSIMERNRDRLEMTEADQANALRLATLLCGRGADIEGYAGEFDVVYDYVTRIPESTYFDRDRLKELTVKTIDGLLGRQRAAI